MKRFSVFRTSDRGAVAVEFALVAPFLLLLLGGIVELAYTYNLQISVTQTAREAAREMSIKNDQTVATAAALARSPGLTTGTFTWGYAPTACAANTDMHVTVTYTASTLTSLFGSSVTVTGVGAMRCGG